MRRHVHIEKGDSWFSDPESAPSSPCDDKSPKESTAAPQTRTKRKQRRRLLVRLKLARHLCWRKKCFSLSSSVSTFAVLFGLLVLLKMVSSVRRRRRMLLSSPLTLYYHRHSSLTILTPPSLYMNDISRGTMSIPTKRIERSNDHDFGGLYIDFFVDENARRPIYRDFRLEMKKKDVPPPQEKHVESYYAFDDDVARNVYRQYEDDTIGKTKSCRRISWHRNLPINCNAIHEVDVRSSALSGVGGYIGGGAYRMVFAIDLESEEAVAFKTNPIGNNFDYIEYEAIRMDGLVSERLSSSSRIADIYGFCALGYVGEVMRYGDMEHVATPEDYPMRLQLDDKDDVDPHNDLLPSQKLMYALEMAEPIAQLHAFPDGVIVHDDIQLAQYLLTNDGRLKLNDFNRAEIMLWNEKDQEYCRYRNNPGNGEWRAPEEYYDFPLNEKIDVFSYGNNLFTLLTGLMPFYNDARNVKEIQARVKAGTKPYIDPRWKARSFAERTIVELIEKCYEYDPDKRISIFEVVSILRQAYKENVEKYLHEDQKVRKRKEPDEEI